MEHGLGVGVSLASEDGSGSDSLSLSSAFDEVHTLFSFFKSPHISSPPHLLFHIACPRVPPCNLPQGRLLPLLHHGRTPSVPHVH